MAPVSGSPDSEDTGSKERGFEVSSPRCDIIKLSINQCAVPQLSALLFFPPFIFDEPFFGIPLTFCYLI